MKRIIQLILPIVFILILFTSCKTASPKYGNTNPFGIIGKNADIYVYIPIKGNRSIVEKALPLADDQSMKKAFSYINTVYSGVFLTDSLAEIRLCAIGKYPYTFTDSIFKKKNGWTRKKTKENYKYYESPYIDISIPNSEIALISLGSEQRENMELILKKMSLPQEPEFSTRFNKLLNSDSGDIGIFIYNSDFFLGQILGVRLGLPLGKMEMYLKKNLMSKNNAQYDYDLIMETNNPQSALVIKLFLQKVLKAEAKIEDNIIIIENKTIPEEKIISIIKSLYPN